MSLAARDLDFRYPHGPRFQDISFDLPAGSLTCLLGPNGSGKSTLLKALMGFIPIGAGSILMHGPAGEVDLRRLRRRDLARCLAYVPQATPLAAISVYEALMMGRSPYMRIVPSHADKRAVEKTIERLGLGTWRDRHLDELSGGERQKALIGLALVQETPVILLDEPASSLDIRYQIELYELLRELCEREGKIIMVAEHDLNLAAGYGDRIFVMRDAGIITRGSPREVFTPELLRRVYEVDSVVTTDESGRTTIIAGSPARRVQPNGLAAVCIDGGKTVADPYS